MLTPHETINKLLEEDEKIIWSGKPALIAYLLHNFPVKIGAIVISTVILLFHDLAKSASGFLKDYFWVIPVFLYIWLFMNYFLPLFNYKRMAYVLTNRRLFLFKGKPFIKYEVIHLQSIAKVAVKRYWFQGDTGEIRLHEVARKDDEGDMVEPYDNMIAVKDLSNVSALINRTR
jgi:hypothetical protein